MYIFGAGLLVGLPLGCYMRERGFDKRFIRAYAAINPDRKPYIKNRELLQNQNEKFYADLKKGVADPKDFERYIYGGAYNTRNTDDRDRDEAKE